MKKIVILGANSEIAQKCASFWAKKGFSLFLVSRNAKKLERLSKKLLDKGASKIGFLSMDLKDFKRHPKMLDMAIDELDGIDIVLIAHGSLPNQKKCENDINETLHEINNNALSTISILTLIANKFEKQKMGKICVISSVAGDRGRSSNYVYGGSKALINTFLSGLRQRLAKSGVQVINIKPGFVKTPMTKNFKKNLFWSTSNFVASKIIKSIEENKDEVYIPKFWYFIMLVIRLLPNKIFKKIQM